MKTFVATSALLALLSIPLHADPVSVGALQTLVTPTAGINGARPAVATAPLGETVITWVQNDASGNVLRVAFLDRSGNLVSGPTTLAIGSLNPIAVVAAATPNAFMVTYSADTATTFGMRNIHYVTFTLSGSQVGSGQCNNMQNLDESRPQVAGNAAGTFITVWVRRQTFGAPPSQGVWARRYDSNGVAIDSQEFRLDDTASLNFSRQDGPTIGIWPSGRFVAAWTDGVFGAGASTLNSPDGHGQGIVCRFFDASANPTTPVMVANSVTMDDQFEALVACDDRDRCLIGWCGDITSNRVDTWARRFDDTGTALDNNDLNLTPTNGASDQFLMGLAATPSGEWFVSWMDAVSTTGQVAPRAGWVRLDQGRNVIQAGLTETGGAATETHSFPRASMDCWGNIIVAWMVADSLSGAGLRYRRYGRQMISFTTSTPPVGGAISVNLDSPSDPNQPYLIGASGGTGPLPIDTRYLKLTQDLLLNYVVFQNGWGGPIFFSFVGVLDASGMTSAPGIVIPAVPALQGLTVHFAFVTGGGFQLPSGMNTISDTYSVTIQ